MEQLCSHLKVEFSIVTGTFKGILWISRFLQKLEHRYLLEERLKAKDPFIDT
jgi:hypothetical protein